MPARSSRVPPRRPMLRFGLAAVLLAALAGAAAVIALPAGAAGSVTTLSASVVPEAADYAAAELADPWDLANPDDYGPSGLGPSGLTGVSLEGGRMGFTVATGDPWFNPVRSIPGALPTGRDGAHHPIATGTYRRISLRLYSSVAGPGQIKWYTCGATTPDCEGGMPYNAVVGWQTVDLPMTNAYNLPKAWAGTVSGLRVVPPLRVGARVEVDWMRLYEPGASVDLAWTSTTSSTLYWDDNDSQADNTPDRPGWGVVATAGGPGSRTSTFPASAYPAGVYRFFTRDASGVSAYSAPLRVEGRPVPVVDQPDAAGGEDWASSVRGRPWDLRDPANVEEVRNATVLGYGAAGLTARNSGPVQNDPHVVLPVPTAIDATRWHRLTVEYSYDGPFDLGSGPGGGTMARLVWGIRGNPTLQESDDILTYAGPNRITLDLATNPAAAVTEPGLAGQVGWAGQAVDRLRFDSNEDPGQKTWRLRDVRLAEDDRSTDGAFDIVFHDAAGVPGTTADIAYDSGPGTPSTRIAGGLAVQPGSNTHHWSAPQLTGTHWITVTLRSPAGATSTARSTGPVRLGAAAPGPAAARGPIGSLDTVERRPGGLFVGGWTLDPDASASTDVHVYVDGRFAAAARADGSRADVAAAYPGYGPAHGYGLLVPAAAGSREVCVYGIDLQGVANTQVGCRRTTVAADPFGSLDVVDRGPGGLSLGGWTIDPETADPLQVHAYVDGRFAGSARADGPRADVAAAFGYGDRHGFGFAVPAQAGTRSVCLYALGVGAGGNPAIGCRTVQVSGTPVGSLNLVGRSGNSLRVAGWALDPDTAARVPLHVYVDGAFAGTGTTGTSRGDVAALHPGYGDRHGFDFSVRGPTGPSTACVYAIDDGGGVNPQLGCRPTG